MKKTPSIFQRNYDGDRLVRDEIVPEAKWVFDGEGVATVKWDGTSVLIRDGQVFARYDAKNGKTPPLGFQPAQDPDPQTGHWPGWVPVKEQPQYRWHLAAIEKAVPGDGTYELLGPMVQGNPHGLATHLLVPHGSLVLDVTRYFDAIRAVLRGHPEWEGIVFHHPDGRMAKIKRKDFGLVWPTAEAKGAGVLIVDEAMICDPRSRAYGDAIRQRLPIGPTEGDDR